MIDLYYWSTPTAQDNDVPRGDRAALQVLPVQIGKASSFVRKFLAVAPNTAFPRWAITSRKAGKTDLGSRVRAMLLYLAERPENSSRPICTPYDVIQWTFWQDGRLGRWPAEPSLPQLAVDKIPYAIDRYVNETNRSTRAQQAASPIANSSAAIFHRRHGHYPGSFPYKNQGRTSNSSRT